MIGAVVLFAGHRVDEPGRNPPRFPPECEPAVRRAIRSSVQRLSNEVKSVMGIAGAADGGDILFHEACQELEVRSEVCLALPPVDYVRTSVERSWTERFFRVLDTHPVVILESGPGDIWERDHEWQLSRARERQPKRIVLLALATKVEETVPGGTSGMIAMARESGYEIIVLDAQKLCS